jgi:outer membrane receptor protein involved in Fe transport
MINDYMVTEQQPPGIFTIIPGLRNVFNYQENISAAYVIFGNKMKQFSYQFGLRAETTDIQTELEQTGEKNPRNYANLFPSAHFTYTITPDNSFQLSYSRRVRRPTYNDLTPFVTFSDNRNFFSGNPNLNPEFTNSFDLGNVRYFDKGSISSSLYYRQTFGKIDRFRTVDTLGFAKTLPVNLSDQQSMGIEIASSYTFTKAYKADVSFNAFRAITDASNINAAFKSDTYSWFVRHSSRIKLGAVDFQVRANYEAPQQTPQGTRGYIAWADLSASKDIMKGNGTLSLSILDIFSSRINRYESRFLEPKDGSGFYTRGESQGRLTSLNLTFNYRFKTTKQAAKQRRSLMDEEN